MERDLTTFCGDHTCDRFYRGALACTIASKQGKRFTLLNIKGQIKQCLTRPVEHIDLFNFQHLLTHACASRGVPK